MKRIEMVKMIMISLGMTMLLGCGSQPTATEIKSMEIKDITSETLEKGAIAVNKPKVYDSMYDVQIVVSDKLGMLPAIEKEYYTLNDQDSWVITKDTFIDFGADADKYVKEVKGNGDLKADLEDIREVEQKMLKYDEDYIEQNGFQKAIDDGLGDSRLYSYVTKQMLDNLGYTTSYAINLDRFGEDSNYYEALSLVEPYIQVLVKDENLVWRAVDFTDADTEVDDLFDGRFGNKFERGIALIDGGIANIR